MRKLKIYSEFAFFIGMTILSAGISLIIKSDLGISPVQSSAYVLYLKYPIMTYGTYNYLFQLVLVSILCILIRKIKFKFLFSFLAGVLYGFSVDFFMNVVSSLPTDLLIMRFIYFFLGFWFIVIGVSLFFRTNIPLMPYDIFVTELSHEKKLNRNNVKIIFDITFLALGVTLSFIFFGKLIGIGIGTIISGLLSGLCIKYFGMFLDKIIIFTPFFKKVN